MKRQLVVLSIVLISMLASITLGLRPVAADALTSSISNLTCTGLTVSGVTDSFGVTMLTIVITNLNTNIDLPQYQVPAGNSQPFSVNFALTGAAPGDVIQARVSANNINQSQATIGPNCVSSGSGATFFNPGDGRVEPRPGERIAAYCNTFTTGSGANMVYFYGILDDSTGVFLTAIKYSDLVAAGGAGITRSVEPNGTVVVWVSNKSKFYVKWYGGPADATGIGDFRKHFSCTFTS